MLEKRWNKNLFLQVELFVKYHVSPSDSWLWQLNIMYKKFNGVYVLKFKSYVKIFVLLWSTNIRIYSCAAPVATFEKILGSINQIIQKHILSQRLTWYQEWIVFRKLKRNFWKKSGLNMKYRVIKLANHIRLQKIYRHSFVLLWLLAEWM